MRCACLALVVALGPVACSASDNGAPEPASGGGSGGAATGGSTASGGSVASGGTWAVGGGGSGTGGQAGSSTGGVAGAGGTPSGDGGACKTSCKGVECGTQMPNLCGGTIDCGVCGDNTDYCIQLTAKYQTAVRDAIDATKTSHPEYFDSNDTMGDSWKVLDLTNFRANVVSLLVSGGLVAIADPNSIEEVRVRSSSETTAENYDIYTSAGYSSYKYTSTCTPANF